MNDPGLVRVAPRTGLERLRRSAVESRRGPSELGTVEQPGNRRCRELERQATTSVLRSLGGHRLYAEALSALPCRIVVNIPEENRPSAVGPPRYKRTSSLSS